MKNLISFFTRIPAGGELEKARKEIWLLPLLGLITAFIPSLVLYYDLPLKGLLSVLLLYSIVGLMHLDGLGDFADGIMVKGSKEEKIRAMKDAKVGTAAVFALLSVLLLQVYALDGLPFWTIFMAEINSKMTFIIMLMFRKPLGDGLGNYFMKEMNTKKLLLAAVIYFALVALFSIFYEIPGISSLSLLVPLYIGKISIDNFGGINGDCMGAAAEITRAASLIIVLLALNFL